MSGEYNAQLELMISSIQALADMAEKVAPAVARVVKADIERTIAAGTTPYGVPWALRKRDGGVPLRNAAKALRVTAVGATVFVRLASPEARHHRGWIPGKVVRQIIPDKKNIPDQMAAAIKGVLDSYFIKEVKHAS